MKDIKKKGYICVLALIERMSGLEEDKDLLLAVVLDPFSRLDFLSESVADAAKRHLYAAAAALAESCFGLLLKVGDKQANNEDDLESEDVERLAEEARLMEMAHSNAEKVICDCIDLRIKIANGLAKSKNYTKRITSLKG